MMFVRGYVARSSIAPLRRVGSGPSILCGKQFSHQDGQRRSFGFATVSAILTPPLVFGGLLVSLWTYKCIMMVVFQNKIIYMPSVPPFSRSEKVSNYASQCRPLHWIEHGIKSTDGTNIQLLEGRSNNDISSMPIKQVVVLYLQGNASSSPPRLPYLSKILASAQAMNATRSHCPSYILVALSYRGFWKSSGSPSQQGIEKDVHAALHWIFDKYPASNTEIVLWGQSIGAGAASVALANLLRDSHGPEKLKRVSGLVLETPFTNLRAMLIALYPQKFLPYRYLAPFLRSTWDSTTALATVLDEKPKLEVLILQAGDDELVPADNASVLEEICRQRGAKINRLVIRGALHTEVMTKPQGRQAISRFIASFGNDN